MSSVIKQETDCNLNNESDEEYLMRQATLASSFDIYTMKAWILTGKLIFPGSFNIQYHAYRLLKETKNSSEAAECLNKIFIQFQNEPILWDEILHLTEAVQNNNPENEYNFERDIFLCLPKDTQHKILLTFACQKEGTINQCRLFLFFLKTFPESITKHSGKLIDILLTSEKQYYPQNCINSYRALLVCDLFPLLLQNSQNNWNSKHLLVLFQKCIEFYLLCLTSDNELCKVEKWIVEDPWDKLISCLELVGHVLGWNLPFIVFRQSENKDTQLHRIIAFYSNPVLPTLDEVSMINHVKQTLYCLFLLLTHYVFGYMLRGNSIPCTLIEGFCCSQQKTTEKDSNYESLKSKRRRMESDTQKPIMTQSSNFEKDLPLTFNFTSAIQCWELLNSSEPLEKEFTRLSRHLHLDSCNWFHMFLLDMHLYHGSYREPLVKIPLILPMATSHVDQLQFRLKLMSSFYGTSKYKEAFEEMQHVINLLSSLDLGQLSSSTMAPIDGHRNVHFICLTQAEVFQYCTQILVHTLQQKLPSAVQIDVLVGLLLILLQYDWPRHETILTVLLEHIRLQNGLNCRLLQHYLILPEILEELMYLASDAGGSHSMDIFVQKFVRRCISTRGNDKEAREDFQDSMRRQVARCKEPLNLLLIHFICNENQIITACLS